MLPQQLASVARVTSNDTASHRRNGLGAMLQEDGAAAPLDVIVRGIHMEAEASHRGVHHHHQTVADLDYEQGDGRGMVGCFVFLKWLCARLSSVSTC